METSGCVEPSPVCKTIDVDFSNSAFEVKRRQKGRGFVCSLTRTLRFFFFFLQLFFFAETQQQRCSPSSPSSAPLFRPAAPDHSFAPIRKQLKTEKGRLKLKGARVDPSP